MKRTLVLIGYPSRQDGCGLEGPMLPVRDFPQWSKPLLTKFVWSRWLYIGLVLFCIFIELEFVSATTTQKRTWPMSSHLDLTLGQ